MSMLADDSRKAEQLLMRGLNMLFSLMTFGTKESEWKFNTSEAATVGVGTPLVEFSVGGNVGDIYLYKGGDSWEDAHDRVRIGYATVGVGLGLSIPLGGGFSVSASYSSTDWPNTGQLYILPGGREFHSAADFNEPQIRAAPCVIITVDGALVPLRWMMAGTPGAMTGAISSSPLMDRQIAGSAAVMFMGVNPSFYTLLEDLLRNLKRLSMAAFHKMPEGFLNQVEDGLMRPARMAWDLAKIELDMLLIQTKMRSISSMANAVLYSAGVEAALPGVGLSVHYGIMKSWENKGKSVAKGAPLLDNIPKPFTTE